MHMTHMTRSRSRLPARLAATALTFVLIACGITPSPVAPTPTVEVPTPTPAATANLTTEDAERAAFVYFSALGRQEYAVARGLLTVELRARTSEANLEASVAGTEAVGLVVIVPMSVTPNRVVFQGVISARMIPGAASEWGFGANTRYLELVRTPDGWRLSQVSAEPIPI